MRKILKEFLFLAILIVVVVTATEGMRFVPRMILALVIGVFIAAWPIVKEWLSFLGEFFALLFKKE